MVHQALQFQKEDDAKIEALERAIGKGDASGIYEGDAFEDIRKEFNLPARVRVSVFCTKVCCQNANRSMRTDP